MNNKLYKLIFSKTHGMMVAVADFATGHGGRGSGAQQAPAAPLQQASLILPLRAVALAAMLMLGTASTLSLAQIVAAPGSGAQVIQTQNGLNQVNIARPSGAGVSVGTFSQFDVPGKGAILNNSPTLVQSQLGGYINGNPNLTPGNSARITVSGTLDNTAGSIQTNGNDLTLAPAALLNDNGMIASAGTRHRSFSDIDDPALTAFVTTLWDELFSRETDPVPPCPHCGRADTRLHLRVNDRFIVPQFRCRACKRLFTRLTGSPMAKLRFQAKMPAFIRMLSQAIPLEEASRRLGIEYAATSNWLMRFRELIGLHDPDGRWNSRVKLGIQYRPLGICPHCSYHGQMQSGGFGGRGQRQVKCPECSRVRPITDEDGGEQVAVSIAHDPALTAVRRRRRKGGSAPELASAGQGVLNVPPRPHVPAINTTPPPRPNATRFDFSQPLSAHVSSLPRRYAEDTALTGYLEAEIAKVLSHNIEPVPRCPFCQGGDTRFKCHPVSSPELPQYQCGACMRLFTRSTGTPMANMLRKDMLFKFLPFLSQHRPAAQVAREFDAENVTIIEWVRRFRAWLLELDPSGEWEQRVRLGLKSPWPVLRCPKCEHEVPAKPHGFLRRKSIPRGQIRLFRCSACNGFFDVPVEALPGA